MWNYIMGSDWHQLILQEISKFAWLACQLRFSHFYVQPQLGRSPIPIGCDFRTKVRVKSSENCALRQTATIANFIAAS
jgi:hypothetical protein